MTKNCLRRPTNSKDGDKDVFKKGNSSVGRMSNPSLHFVIWIFGGEDEVSVVRLYQPEGG